MCVDRLRKVTRVRIAKPQKGSFALAYPHPPNAVTGESQAAILAEKLKK
jgi:hypothetical protein